LFHHHLFESTGNCHSENSNIGNTSKEMGKTGNVRIFVFFRVEKERLQKRKKNPRKNFSTPGSFMK